MNNKNTIIPTTIYLLDGNIMNELALPENIELVNKLKGLVEDGKLIFIQDHVAWEEVDDIKKSHKYCLYSRCKKLRKTLQIQEVSEETVVLDYSKFPIPLGTGKDSKKHYGNKTSQKKKKDSHIYAATKNHGAILVTNNLKDFKNLDIQVISFNDFKCISSDELVLP